MPNKNQPACFYGDNRSINAWKECDWEKEKLDLQTCLQGLQKRKARIYVTGVFDLFHWGHAEAIHQAYTSLKGPIYIIVGIADWNESTNLKGKRPILSVKERANLIRHLTGVDEIILNSPFITTREFVKKHKIDFVCHDPEPYPVPGNPDIFGWLKNENILLPIQRTEGISTTDLIERVLQIYVPQTIDSIIEDNNCLSNLSNSSSNSATSASSFSPTITTTTTTTSVTLSSTSTNNQKLSSSIEASSY
jgi:cytidyltransferase-like protein